MQDAKYKKKVTNITSLDLNQLRMEIWKTSAQNVVKANPIKRL